MKKDEQFVDKVWTELCSQELLHIYNYLLKKRLDKETAEDIVQKSLLNLWKWSESERGSHAKYDLSQLKRMLHTIVKFTCIEYLRTRKNVNIETDFELEKIISPASDAAIEMAREDFMNELEKSKTMTEIDKTIMKELLSGSSNKKIAQILNISNNLVRVKITRARKKLKSLLRDYSRVW